MEKPPIDDLEKITKEMIEKRNELIQELNIKRRNCCLGCLTPIVVVVLLMVGSMVYVCCQPYFKPMIKCLENQMELNDAIRRYRDGHEEQYPESLKDLEAEYLKDKSVLYCPLDGEKEGYTYNNPNKDKEAEWVTTCPRHKLDEKHPFPPIGIDKNGKFVYKREEFKP